MQRKPLSGKAIDPQALGKEVTEMLVSPTIGICAGPDCSGQVLSGAGILLLDLEGRQDGWPQHTPHAGSRHRWRSRKQPQELLQIKCNFQ